MTAPTKTICAVVTTPDGLRVECDWQQILSTEWLMPMYYVTARKGYPFDGRKMALVPQSRITEWRAVEVEA